jgi:glycerophosphoryl diester phosphodiesterase
MGRLRFGPAIAHRGDSQRAPENTAAAFESAIVAGCDMIELDARLTGDHQVVVLHDDDLARHGHRGRVKEMSAAELAELDAGSWFAPAFAGQRYLTLAAALELIGGRVPVNVEIKLEVADQAVAAHLVGRVLEVVGEERIAVGEKRTVTGTAESSDTILPQVIFSTFSEAVFRELRRQAPAAATAFLVGHFLGRRRILGHQISQTLFKRVSVLFAEVIPRVAAAGAEGLHIHRTLVAPDVVSAAHDADLSLRVYTVNDAALCRRLLAMGCDGLFSDDIEMLVREVRG